MKTRFCPSPTGFIHLGNARTALFNFLFAHAQNGHFLYRVEDTDQQRFKPEFDVALAEDLKWLGLHWDEGPGKEHAGDGPYYQSQRQAIYDDYYQRLEDAGLAYPCFCSEEQLALSRKLQRARGQPPRYSGVCRALSKAEIEEKIKAGQQPTLRFRVEDHQEVVFHDLVRGEQRFKTDDIGDFIIRRGNGMPSFMFCNAIDDALMGVTYAMRGEDHLTNTPRQILIQQALGLAVPTYGHIALIVGPDGSPLSKRHGSRSIRELRQNGYLAIAVNNYMARLGHYYADDAFMTLVELSDAFKVESLSRSPAKFNLQQLHYWQKEAVMRLSQEEFYAWIDANVLQHIPMDKRELFYSAIQPNVLFPAEVAEWVNVCFARDLPPWDEAGLAVLQATGSAYFTLARETYLQKGAEYSVIMDVLKQELSLKGKALFQPLRLALTGQAHGPELAKLLSLMEAESVLQRLNAALATTQI